MIATTVTRSLAFAAALVAVAGVAEAQNFDNANFTPITRLGVNIRDAVGDHDTVRRDILSAAIDSVFIGANQIGGTFYLYFRIRVDGDPIQNNSFRGDTWGCMIDRDGVVTSSASGDSYEEFVHIDGDDDRVEVHHNTTENGAASIDDTAETAGDTFTIPSNGRSVAVGADFYIDMVVPFTAVGITSSTVIRVVCGTYTNTDPRLATDSDDGDYAHTDHGGTHNETLPHLISDPFVCGATGCSPCTTSGACGLTCGACANPTPSCGDAAGGAEVFECIPCTLDDECEGTATCELGSCVSPCVNDDDCDGDERCDIVTGNCEVCLTNADCGATTPHCEIALQPNVCEACQVGTQAVDCTTPGSPACQPDGSCDQCSATNTTLCTLGSGKPFCETDDDHPLEGKCVVCVNNNGCSGTTPTCDDDDTDVCRACAVGTEAHDCSATAAPACQTDGRCDECRAGNTSRCTTLNKAHCNLTTGKCVDCITGDDCPGGTPVCSNGVCGTGLCVDDDDCGGATPACQADGSCGECSIFNDDLCTGGTPVCDPVAAECVECVIDGDCPSDRCDEGTHLCESSMPDAGVPDAPLPPDAAAPDAPLPMADARPPDAAPVPDSRPPDAATPPDARPPDAAPPTPDAMALADAAPMTPDARPLDARLADARDTNPVDPTGIVEGGGCSCRTGGEPSSPANAAWLLVGLVALLARRRR